MDTTKTAWRAMALAMLALAPGAPRAQSTLPPYPPKEITLTVAAGEKAAIWVQPNYSVLCRSLGQPTFELDSTPTLGEVIPEWIDYTVPAGQRCESMRFPGMVVWYQAGKSPGIDVVTWTVGFPRELGSHTPTTGDHRVTTTIVVN